MSYTLSELNQIAEILDCLDEEALDYLDEISQDLKTRYAKGATQWLKDTKPARRGSPRRPPSDYRNMIGHEKAMGRGSSKKVETARKRLKKWDLISKAEKRVKYRNKAAGLWPDFGASYSSHRE